MNNFRVFPLLICICLFSLSMAAQAQERVSLMTYNIKFDDKDAGELNWAARKGQLISLLNWHKPDVFGTQEALLHQLHDMEKGLPGYKWTGVGRADGKSEGEFTAIFFNANRFTLVDHGTFWLSETPGKPSKSWGAQLNRICSWAHLKEGNQDLWVYNLHLSHVSNEARLNSVKVAYQKIREHNPDGPLVLMGDFNFSPGMEPYRFQKNESLLEDSYHLTEMDPLGPAGTYNGFKAQPPFERRIDYIWVNDGLKVHEYATLTGGLTQHFPSDHFPVMIKASFR